MRANELSRFIVVSILGTLVSSCVQTGSQETKLNPGKERIQLQVSGARLLDASAQEESVPPAAMESREAEEVDAQAQESAPKQESESGNPAQEETGEVLELSAEKKAADESASQEGKKASNPAEEKIASPFDPEALFLRTIEEVIPDNRPITIERSESLTVPQLLEAIGKFGGFNVAIADGLETLKIARVNFPNIPLRDAFIAVLKRYQLNITRVGDVLWIDRGNRAGDEMIFRIFRLSSISAESLRPQLQAILAGGASSSSSAAPSGGSGGSSAPASGSSSGGAGATANGYFTIHPDSNTIFMRAKPELIEAMTKFISAVDFQGQQVMIEMKIYEVALNDATSIGTALTAANFMDGGSNGDYMSNFLFATDANPNTVLDAIEPGAYEPDFSDKTQLGIFRLDTGDRVKGFLQLLQTMSSTDLLSAPRIVAVNGKAAEINIIDKIPYIQQTTNNTSSGSSETITYVFEDVGIKLKVTPTIQEDRHVRMQVETEISEFTGRVSDDEASAPIIVERTSRTELVVGDQQTLAMGGLMRNNLTYSESKIPLLGDIPYLGALFRSTAEEKRKLELLILMTPQIMNDDNSAQRVTQQELDRMDNVRKTQPKKPIFH